MDHGYCNLAWLELIKTSLSSVKRRQVRTGWCHFTAASSLLLWTFIFSTRDQEVWGPLGNQSISLPICLCLSSPRPNLLCIYFESNFLNHLFGYVVPHCLPQQQEKVQSALVWYSGPRRSCINLLYSASFAYCYSDSFCLPFPNTPCDFLPSSPWSCYFCCLECLFMQYKLKFTHSPCPPPSPTSSWKPTGHPSAKSL